MQKITSFFWFCSGANIALLKRCTGETSKYVGIGATIFFTGLFAAIAASYSLYTVFDNVWTSATFGFLWGLMIFNLDRYIVSSMRKEGRFSHELLTATPRIILAVIISIVIARPLELKIFDKEIQSELIIMEQQKYAAQEAQLRTRFVPAQDSIKRQIVTLKAEITTKTEHRDALLKIAREEADGTGGSKKKNLGPIYKIKKADAEKAEHELNEITAANRSQIIELEAKIVSIDKRMEAELNSLSRPKLNGLAARMEALHRVAQESNAITWAHWFIMLLFVAIETAPVFVKLISSRGPFDNLLRIDEHRFIAEEIELVATTNAETKERTANLPQHERTFVTDKLDAELNR